MVTGIQKYAGHQIKQRGSSPKLQVLNTALISSQEHRTFLQAQKDTDYWGRLVESTVGAYLINSSLDNKINVFYWREGVEEVDFILQAGKKLLAIEVKSNSRNTRLSGIKTFCVKFKTQQSLLIGGQGLPLEKFLNKPIEYWLEN